MAFEARALVHLYFLCTSVVFSAVPGSIDPSFQVSVRTQPELRIITRQPGGSFLVSGRFRFVNDQLSFNLARILPDGRLDASFRCDLPYHEEITAQGTDEAGRVLISTRERVLRLQENGQVDSTFQVGEFDQQVYTSSLILNADQSAWFVGAYQFYNNQPNTGITKLHQNGKTDEGYHSPFATVGQSLGAVRGTNSDFFVYGDFTMENSGERKYLVRLNLNGEVDSDFEAEVLGRVVLAQVTPQGKLLVGLSGNAHPRIIRLNYDGTQDNSFNFPASAPSNQVTAITFRSNGSPIVVLSDVRGIAILGLNEDGSIDNSFNAPKVDQNVTTRALVHALVPFGINNFFIGGRIASLGGNDAFGGGILNQEGTFISQIPTLFQDVGSVEKLVVHEDDKILLSGNFFWINGRIRRGFARLYENGELDDSFVVPRELAGNLPTFALQNDGRIVIGCSSLSPDPHPYNIIRVHSSGSLDMTFNSGLPLGYQVEELAVQSNGKIVVGGTHLARLDANGSIDTNFQVRSNVLVRAIFPAPDEQLWVDAHSLFLALVSNNGEKSQTFSLPGQGYGSVQQGEKLIYSRSRTIHEVSFDLVSRELYSFTNGNVSTLDLAMDGTIVCVHDNQVKLIKPNGELDTNFVSTVPVMSRELNPFDALASQSNGKILVAGNFAFGTNHNFNLLRLVRTPEARLTIGVLPDGEIELSWPRVPGTFNLQQSSAVGGPWLPYTGTGIVTLGDSNMVLVLKDFQASFFRLSDD